MGTSGSSGFGVIISRGGGWLSLVGFAHLMLLGDLFRKIDLKEESPQLNFICVGALVFVASGFLLLIKAGTKNQNFHIFFPPNMVRTLVRSFAGCGVPNVTHCANICFT